MDSDQPAPLLASQGATISGLVAQVANGWRASAVLQLQTLGQELQEQIVGPKILASKDAAQEWLQQVGKDHGFASVHIVFRLLSDAEKKTEATPADKDDRGGTFWDR